MFAFHIRFYFTSFENTLFMLLEKSNENKIDIIMSLVTHTCIYICRMYSVKESLSLWNNLIFHYHSYLCTFIAMTITITWIKPTQTNKLSSLISSCFFPQKTQDTCEGLCIHVFVRYTSWEEKMHVFILNPASIMFYVDRHLERANVQLHPCPT